MMTTATITIEQQSLSQDLSSDFLETIFDVIQYIEIDDLESIMTTEFAQGLPSDTESGVF